MLYCYLILFKARTPKSCYWMTIIEVRNINTILFTKRCHIGKQLIPTIFSRILNKSFCWMNQKQNINNILRLFLQGLTKQICCTHNFFHQMQDKYKIKRLQVIVRTIGICTLGKFLFVLQFFFWNCTSCFIHTYQATNRVEMWFGGYCQIEIRFLGSRSKEFSMSSGLTLLTFEGRDSFSSILRFSQTCSGWDEEIITSSSLSIHWPSSCEMKKFFYSSSWLYVAKKQIY